MALTPFQLVLERLGNRIVSRNGAVATARCPAHDDQRPSLTVTQAEDGKALLCCGAGCKTERILKAIGLNFRDLFPSTRSGVISGRKPLQRKALAGRRAALGSLRGAKGPAVRVATYRYLDETGELLFEVLRYEPKDFRQRRPDGKGGWLWNLDGVRRVPYRLPELLVAPKEVVIFIPEGEKDCDQLRALGLVATTNPGGAGKWKTLDINAVKEALGGRDVVVLPDNDDAGRKHGDDVAQRLHGVAAEIKILELPGLSEKGDLSNWIDAGHTAAELAELAMAAAPLRAEDADDEAGDDGPAPPEGRAITRLVANVAAEPLRWLWRARIPRGKFTLLAGDPGAGKSMLTVDLTARVTTGAPWPDAHSPRRRREPGGVVMLSAEDDVADTIRPRLEAAGANLTRVAVLDAVVDVADRQRRTTVRRWPSLRLDLDAIDEAIDSVADCALVIIDPVAAYLDARDSHRDADVRAVLGPLAELAARRHVAVVGVCHLRKSTAESALHRPGGSIALVAAARAAWLVTADPDDGTGCRRLLLPLKCNLGPPPGGLAYVVETYAPAARVRWLADVVTRTADDVMDAARDRVGRRAEREIDRWLAEALAHGPRPAKEIMVEATEMLWSRDQVRRARQRLGAQVTKTGYRGGWLWGLPKSAPCADTCAHDSSRSSRSWGEVENAQGREEREEREQSNEGEGALFDARLAASQRIWQEGIQLLRAGEMTKAKPRLRKSNRRQPPGKERP
jgi:hypothetical protein